MTADHQMLGVARTMRGEFPAAFQASIKGVKSKAERTTIKKVKSKKKAVAVVKRGRGAKVAVRGRRAR